MKLGTYKKQVGFIFFISFVWLPLFSQKKTYTLQIFPHEISDQHFLKKIKWKRTFNDSLTLISGLEDMTLLHHKKGFITAGFDSILFDSSQVIAYFNQGLKYTWGQLQWQGINDKELNMAGVPSKKLREKAVNPRRISIYRSKILTYLENNGYPFAKIIYNYPGIDRNHISLNIQVERGNKVILDSVFFKGDHATSPTFLSRYFSLFPGNTYQEDKIKKLSILTSQLKFVTEIREPQTAFLKDKARVYLYLEKNKSNLFSGFLGFQQDADKKKFSFTGDVNLLLINSFKRGETLSFIWKKPETGSQFLNLSVKYPFMFSSPLGFHANFQIFKKDTTYLNNEIYTGITYPLNYFSEFVLFYSYLSSGSLARKGGGSIVTDQEIADMGTSLYGVQWNVFRTDNVFNPRRGFTMHISSSVGNKKLKDISSYESIGYPVKSNYTQYFVKAEISSYFNLFSHSVIVPKLKTGGMFSEVLFQNELFRLGGMNDLRGVDEESVLASRYLIATLEWRFLIGENSHLFFFTDKAWYQQKTIGKNFSDDPLGLGLGINLETRAGIFSLVYALGKEFQNPIGLKNAKIHIGYQNRF